MKFPGFKRVKVVACNFSGGRDSALACYIAARVARVAGVEFRLLHIDTGVYVNESREYVVRYAEWLGADLEIIKSGYDYWELVKNKGYPLLFHYRWCVDKLKKQAVIKWLRGLPRLGIPQTRVVQVLGVRGSESRFKARTWEKAKPLPYFWCWERWACSWIWLPIVRLSDWQVITLVKRFEIPESPVWGKLGISGDCLCMAGMGMRTLDRLIAHYPDLAKQLAERDREVQKVRRRDDPMYPAPLFKARIPLHKYIEAKLRQARITDYTDYYGAKACATCLLPFSQAHARGL